jgi:hypothetical protein
LCRFRYAIYLDGKNLSTNKLCKIAQDFGPFKAHQGAHIGICNSLDATQKPDQKTKDVQVICGQILNGWMPAFSKCPFPAAFQLPEVFEKL